MRVQLFGTCMVDTFFPETGTAVLKLLRHFGVEVAYPNGQTCCGKPPDSGGYARESRKAAEHFISVFGGGSDPIVVPSGSCASMVKNHYPQLFEDNPAMSEKAHAIAGRTYGGTVPRSSPTIRARCRHDSRHATAYISSAGYRT